MAKLQLKTNTALVEILNAAESQTILTQLLGEQQQAGLVQGLVVNQQGAKYDIVKILQVGEQVDLNAQVPQLQLNEGDHVIVSAGAISLVDGIQSTNKRGFIFTDNAIAKVEL